MASAANMRFGDVARNAPRLVNDGWLLAAMDTSRVAWPRPTQHAFVAKALAVPRSSAACHGLSCCGSALVDDQTTGQLLGCDWRAGGWMATGTAPRIPTAPYAGIAAAEAVLNGL